MKWIVLLVLFIMSMFIWFLAMVDAVQLSSKWLPFVAVLVLGIATFLDRPYGSRTP